MKKVAIIPGFAEGPWHTKDLRAELNKRGFKVIDDLGHADIIVAHSAGCYRLPKQMRARTVILVGPPFWPRKLMLQCFIQKVYRDARARKSDKQLPYWLLKTAWNTIYFLGDLRVALGMALSARRRTWQQILADHQTLIVRNRHDAWTTPDLHRWLDGKGSFGLLSLPGEHDDIWVNPEPYVNLVQSSHFEKLHV